MSPAHKQRLVGAIVLVALGLIIIPTVLDFSRNERADNKGTAIPPGPDAMQMEVLPLDEWSKKIEPGVSSQETGGEAPGVGGAAPAEPAPEPAGEAQREAAPAVARSEPKTTAVPEMRADTPVVVAPTPAPEQKAEVAAGVGKWVVQVASLTVEAKAIGLRDQLHKAGYPALVEQAKGSSGVVYRVKAGPVQSRAEADDLKKQIKQSTKLDGLVMRAQ